MKLLSRVVLALAAVALVAGFVLGAVPVKVYPANGPPTEKVTCGTGFSDTKWSSDDACEGPLIGQRGAMLFAFLLCVVFFVLGVGALILSFRRELRRGIPA